ncbi:MAG: restriction endonuclease subunit S, partial [archaeon]|nr:restriction endonuclease subunit S [archaeon]
MLTFDRVDFEKSISLSAKKKVKIESKWDVVKLGDIVEILDEKRIPVSKRDRTSGEFPYYGATGIIDYIDKYIFEEKLILIGEDGAKWGANENSAFSVDGKYWVNNHAHVLRPKRELVFDEFIIEMLNKLDLSFYITGLNVPKLNQNNLREIKIPLPSKDIQGKIISEIELLEQQEQKAVEELAKQRHNIGEIISKSSGKLSMLEEITSKIGSGATPSGGKGSYQTSGISLIRSQNIYDN